MTAPHRILTAKIVEHPDPAAPLISLAAARRQCEIVAIDIDSDGVESHPDDPLIVEKLDAAIEHAEAFTGRSFALRVYEVALDSFPSGAIELPRPPLVGVLSFTYGDGTDAVEMTEGVEYVVDDYGPAALLRPLTAWPSITASPNTVRVQFLAGCQSEEATSEDAPPLPAKARAAILLVLGHLYRNREQTTEKALEQLPFGFSSLLRSLRVSLGMA